MVLGGWPERGWEVQIALCSDARCPVALLVLLLLFQKQACLRKYIYICLYIQTERENVHFFHLRELSSFLFPGHIKNTSPAAALMLLYWQDYHLGDTGGQNKFINFLGWAPPPSPAETRTAAFPASHLKRVKFLWKSVKVQDQV